MVTPSVRAGLGHYLDYLRSHPGMYFGVALICAAQILIHPEDILIVIVGLAALALGGSLLALWIVKRSRLALAGGEVIAQNSWGHTLAIAPRDVGRLLARRVGYGLDLFYFKVVITNRAGACAFKAQGWFWHLNEIKQFCSAAGIACDGEWIDQNVAELRREVRERLGKWKPIPIGQLA